MKPLLSASRTRSFVRAAVAAVTIAFAAAPAAGQEWRPWNPGSGDDADLALSSRLEAAPGYRYALHDLDADGAYEILVQSADCRDGACRYMVLSFDFGGRRWVMETDVRATRMSIETIEVGGEVVEALSFDGVPWFKSPDGMIPAVEPVYAAVEERDPYVDEIRLLDRLLRPAGTARDELWATVYDVDIDGDGRPGRIFVVRTPALCMQGAYCPFVAVDDEDRELARGISMDTPLLLDDGNGGYALIATVPAGYVFHDAGAVIVD